MTEQQLKLTRLVTMEECHWLNRDFEAGETVYEYHGFTYGCVSPSGQAVSLVRGEGPFLELPSDAIAKATGGSNA